MNKKQQEEFNKFRNLKGLKPEDTIFLNFHLNRDLYETLIEEATENGLSLEQLILNILSLNMLSVEELENEQNIITCDRCHKDINLKTQDSLLLENTSARKRITVRLCYDCSNEFIQAYNERSRKRRFLESEKLLRK